MTTSRCPECGQPLATDDINIKEGVALCRSCGKLSRLGELDDTPAPDPQTLLTPPAGCSYCESGDGAVIIRASLRSVGAAIGLAAVCLFWNGIVSVFVLVAIGGLYTHFVGPLPHWFPVSSGGGKHGHIGPNGPLGETLFMCVFLIPFVLVGLVMLVALLTCLVGRVEVSIPGSDGGEGRVRTGFGSFNWTHRFDASRVKRVAVGKSSWERNGERKPLIRIEADRTVEFGSTLREERRAWMFGVLQLLLTRAKSEGRKALGLSALGG